MVKKVSRSGSSASQSSSHGAAHSASDAAGSHGAGRSASHAGAHVSGAVKESAQQIWLAGLGAFSRAQEEGGKMFETLVQQGVNLQRKTQSAAEEKITEATQRMASMATDISSKASGQWDKLEGIFEERVSRALNKLGVPSAKDVDALIARIDELSRLVAQMGGTPAKAAKATKAAKTTGAAKATAKATTKTATTKTATAKPSTKKAANKPAGKASAKRSQAAA